MRYMKKNTSGYGSGMMAFVLCSLFLLCGAAAGCYSGAHADVASLSLAESGRSFGEYLVINFVGVGLALLLGSSCVGFLILPLLNGTAGFICGFVMTAVMLFEGSWGRAFVGCGWIIVLALPVFSVLCACAARASASACRAVLLGVRADGEALNCFVKMLMISTALAILLAIAASAI